MQPQNNTTYRRDLVDVLEENMLGAGQFVGEMVMPSFSVDAESGKFAKIDFDTVKTAVVEDRRGPSGNYNQVQHATSKDTYTTIDRGLEELVDVRDSATIGKFFDAEKKAAAFCQYYLRLNREARVASFAFDDTVMAASTFAAGVKWDVPATAKPVDNIQEARNLLITQMNGMLGEDIKIIGIGNNTARRDLMETDDIKDRAYGGGNLQPGLITETQLALILGLDEVRFSGLLRGGSDIWTNTKFGIYAVSSSTELRVTPQFGRSFTWGDTGENDIVVESYHSDARRSEVVRVRMDSVEKVLSTRAGVLITAVK